MIELVNHAVVLDGCGSMTVEEAKAKGVDVEQARKNTLTARILAAHNMAREEEDVLRIRFDAMASHDITYVGIIQTARASGLKAFPLPYVLTNCHNSLCAVGGTINEDDHVFGLSAARKYGGIYVPAHLAVIHQYVREMLAACGGMILGSDSHTRYGALGVMGVGEGGPELVKQLLGKTWDIARPQTVAVWLTGTPCPGVGPQDVALALIAAVFQKGFVKNKVLEFQGPGVANLSVEYRCGLDVMSTETTCLSSIWITDEAVRTYLRERGREQDFRSLAVQGPACYDALIRIDLGKIVPMIALPFHPSNALPVAELVRHGKDILAQNQAEAEQQFGPVAAALNLPGKWRNGHVWADQGIIAGCAGGSFENLHTAAAILQGQSIGQNAFSLSCYPASQPQALALMENGSAAKLLRAGAVLKNAFCGPCFGAGDTPANGALSLRHTTRNFPNREGSKPANGQLAAVALMDARSIAATAANGGRLTPATDLDWNAPHLAELSLSQTFDSESYRNRVFNGYGQAQPEAKLVFGPNIADWPTMTSLPRHLLLQVASVIRDPVTTTDELIPSGETSSLRSNPLKLAEYTLSRKDPAYVGRAKAVADLEKTRLAEPAAPKLLELVRPLFTACGHNAPTDLTDVGLGSTIVAMKPGDGSAREQAASSQKVLGGWANLAVEYATKRYRSNLINWGMLPFLVSPELAASLAVGDWLLVPDVRQAVQEARETLSAFAIHAGQASPIALSLGSLTADERQTILDGCLINFYNAHP